MFFISKERLTQKGQPPWLGTCRNPGLNQGPLDLQSNALPTELFRPTEVHALQNLRISCLLDRRFNQLSHGATHNVACSEILVLPSVTHMFNRSIRGRGISHARPQTPHLMIWWCPDIRLTYIHIFIFIGKEISCWIRISHFHVSLTEWQGAAPTRGTHGYRAILIPDTPQTQILEKSLIQTETKTKTEYADLLLFIKKCQQTISSSGSLSSSYCWWPMRPNWKLTNHTPDK